ncbi:MAG: trypsin-like peptidase domain-containing protein [Acidobacteria bacterium]|nr:trypsin-like peptidase domain-containing protein [Acidobacteriota bacterium]
MTRGFAWLTAALTATIGLLVGAILAGSFVPSAAVSAPVVAPAVARPVAPVLSAAAAGFPTSFADVAERANPAVVSIDVASRQRQRRATPRTPDDDAGPRRPEAPRRGTGTGFIVDQRGLIITNQHVVEGAERVMVKLADGRSFRATVVGTDPDIDLAVLKVEAGVPLPELPLGDSDDLRVGEWVCAIGNPYAYEHTVTVGVVSFVGRKLFDQSLDQYIQTDAAISFGNSGGPLLNTAGEVVGINTAVSRQASNIGFAIPVNQVREVLPQLVETGRVARGYLGVALRGVDSDLRQALGLGPAAGAIVEDVTPGSPASRAGLRPYDVITAIDGRLVDSDQAMIRVVSRGVPGQPARVDYLRDGREMTAVMKLAERPTRVAGGTVAPGTTPAPQTTTPQLGLTLIEVHPGNARRYDLPNDVTGLLVQRVEPVSPAAEAGLERGQVLLHVNRRPVGTIAGLRKILAQRAPGDAVAVLVLDPRLDQRLLRVVRADPR